MEGVRRRIKREARDRLELAHTTAAFTRTKKLERLDSYLRPERPNGAQSGSEVLAVMRELQSRGAKMNIRRLH